MIASTNKFVYNCNFLRISADTKHQFNARKSSWGFPTFMPLDELMDPGRGFLVNGTLIFEVQISVDNSKEETSFVGLKNQGATCYMNSLLQTLYHIPYFRKVRLFIITSSIRPYFNGNNFGICISDSVPYANN